MPLSYRPNQDYFDEGYYLRGGLFERKMFEWKDRAGWLKKTFSPERALEIGAGEGCLLLCLRELGVDAVGLDISRYGSYFTKQLDRVLGDDSILPFHDASFDFLTGFDIFEHNMEEYIDRMVAELGRVAKPHAKGFFNIALAGQTTDTEEVDPTHFTLRPRDWWVEKLSRSFDVVGTGRCPTLTFQDAQFTVEKR